MLKYVSFEANFNNCQSNHIFCETRSIRNFLKVMYNFNKSIKDLLPVKKGFFRFLNPEPG